MLPDLRSALRRLARATHRPAGSWLFHAITITTIATITLAITYTSVGRPKLLGIDDADITQVYARHLAQGAGYVYTPGGDHVEGATSLLWVLINAAAFRVIKHPEGLIFAIGCLLTLAPMILIAHVADCIAPDPQRAGTQRIAVLIWFACLPGYFTWLALTLMDQALWASALALVFTILAAELLNRLKPRPFQILSSLAAILAIMARPEASAQVPLLLAFASLAAWKLSSWPRARLYAAPVIATIAALSALTLWRLAYFGYPFPNTFYAKVSSTEWDNIASGYDYVKRFLLTDAFNAVAMLAVIAATALAKRRLFFAPSPAPRQAVVFLAGTTVIMALCLQVAIGGDHFGSFRLLQPILPLCAIPLAYLVAEFRARVPARTVAAVIFLPLAIVLPSREIWLYLRNGNIGQEFYIGNTGRRMGQILNGLIPQRNLSVGVAAAGGIALTYHGPVLDLLGLNWALMAHATSRRSGLRGHSAFSEAIFWDHMPDLALPMWVENGNLGSVAPYLAFYQGVFHHLLTEPHFRNNYTPILYASPLGTVLVFCRAGLLTGAPEPGVVPLAWDRIAAPP